MDNGMDDRETVIRALIRAAKAQGLDPAEVLAGLDAAGAGRAGLPPEAEALLSRVLGALGGHGPGHPSPDR